MQKLSDKQRIIQEHRNLKESERYQAELLKNLEETEAASSMAMKKLSKKQKIIQEQVMLIK